MKKRNLLVLAGALAFTTQMYAQTLNLQWAGTVGGL